MKKNGSQKWTTAKVLEIREKINRELTSLEESPNLEEFVLDKIITYQSSIEDPFEYIHLFFYVRYLLSIKIERSCDSEVKKFTDLALNILKINKINPNTSRMAFLYSEIYLLVAKYKLSNGQEIESLKNFSLAKRYSSKSTPEAKPNFTLFKADFYFSTGFILKSLEVYHQSLLENLEKGEGKKEIEYSILKIIKGLRFINDISLANQLDEKITTYSEYYSTQLISELKWERIWRKSQSENNYYSLFYQTKKGKSHHKGSFILDCLYLSAARINREKIEFKNFPKPSTVFRNKGMTNSMNLFSLKNLMLIEQLDDPSRPLEAKLEISTKILKNAKRILNPDHKQCTYEILSDWTIFHNFMDINEMIVKEKKVLVSNASQESNKNEGKLDSLLENLFIKSSLKVS